MLGKPYLPDSLKRASHRLTSFGAPETVMACARRAWEQAPAYRRHLAAHGIDALTGNVSWRELPPMDKKSYLGLHRSEDLVAAELSEKILYWGSSSGSSGEPFYWPTLRWRDCVQAGTAPVIDLDGLWREAFRLRERKTLVLYCIKVGAWSPGAPLLTLLYRLIESSDLHLGLAVATHSHEEAADIARRLGSHYEQCLFVTVPSLVRPLREALRLAGVDLSRARFSVLGECFPEELREQLDAECGLRWPDIGLVSDVYASSDTGVIGAESMPSIALRKLLLSSRPLREALGLREQSLANLYNLTQRDLFVEELEGELLFTRWQAIPIIRYNLHDRGELWDWEELRKLLRALEPSDERQAALKQRALDPSNPHQTLVAVYGRNDALIITGDNFYDSDFLCALSSAKLEGEVTGVFFVSLSRSEEGQGIAWDIEVRPEVAITDELRKKIASSLAESFRRAVHLRAYVDMHGSRQKGGGLFEVRLHPWPELTSKQDAKLRVIRS
ncbi:MAG: hypothetical protein AAB036_10175 [Elusimicrobiota bacterium]